MTHIRSNELCEQSTKTDRRFSAPNANQRVENMAHKTARRPLSNRNKERIQFMDDMDLGDVLDQDNDSLSGSKTDLVRYLSQESFSDRLSHGQTRVHLKALFAMPTMSYSQNAEVVQLQEKLLRACEIGNTKLVEEVLHSGTEFNVNCTDILGRTPLQIALEKEDVQMIEILLPKSSVSNIQATLLHAINERKEAIACSIIRNKKYKEHAFARTGTQRGLLNTDFCATSGFYLDTTPLILASQHELYTVVKLLLLQGEEIERPHPYDCPCRSCEDKSKRDYLRHAHRRLNAYRGLTSTSYITLNSPDPFSEAFQLKKEVLHLVNVEKYFKYEYQILLKKLSTFLVKLIDSIRGTKELDLVLDKVDGERVDCKLFEPMARFRYAIYHKEKKFIAHPSCQMKLNQLWYDKARFLQRSNWLKRILMFFIYIIVYPFVAVVHIFFPGIERLSILDTPAMKFMAHAYSFFLFIFFLTVKALSLTAISHLNFSGNYSCDLSRSYKITKSLDTLTMVLRKIDLSTLDVLIILWVIGMLWNKCRKLYKVGAREHLDRYNIYEAIDTTIIVLFITQFSLKWVTIHKTKEAWEMFALHHCSLDTEHWYWLNPDRYYWNQADPMLLSEILFSTATILSFARIFYVLAANETLGPLQISLGRMTVDVMRFVLLFILLFIAFMVGINDLLSPFYDEHRAHSQLARHPNDNNDTMAVGSNFGLILVTFRSIFWLTLGLAEYEIIDMLPYDLMMTQNAAYILLGAHIFCIVIVMLNMLIAMMSRSYEQIEQEEDIEFKFARSRLYLEYCDSFLALPVPLNLIPSPKVIQIAFNYIHSFIENKSQDRSGKDSPEAGGTLGGRRYKELYMELKTVQYSQVITNIVQRFISDVTKSDDDEIDNGVDIVRQDILRMRSEVSNFTESQHYEQKFIADELTSVKQSLAAITAQQEDIMQCFTECITKLNTFENIIACQLRREDVLSGHYDVSDDESTSARHHDNVSRGNTAASGNPECFLS